MTFYSPGPIFFQYGPITIRYYGLMYLIGFLLATIMLQRLANRYKTDAHMLINCALVTFLGGICGARLYFVLLSWPYFINHLDEVLAIWQGGLSIHGGIIGGALATILYCKSKRLPILATGDLLGTSVPLAQFVGRWGNFFNCELFGLPVNDDFPIKQYIPPQLRPARFSSFQFFQPTFLYEAIWDLFLFLALYFIVLPKFKRYPGMTFFIYVAGYSIGRILIEPLRVDSIMWGEMQIPLLASVIFLIFALFIIYFLWMRKSNTASHDVLR